MSRIGKDPRKTTLAGQKRKSEHGGELSPALDSKSPREVAKGYGRRRSKTMSSIKPMSNASSLRVTAVSPTPPRFSPSTLSGRSILLDRNAGSAFQRSTGGSKTDSTHTDYFRLKAIGIDPETPSIPDTKSSLARKRRRQEEVPYLTSRKRASTLSSVRGQTSDHCDTSGVNCQAPRYITTLETSTHFPQQTQPEAMPRSIEDDDDFLKQIREVRAALSEDTEWFRMQAAQIKDEVEQEELRRSASQQSSTNSTGVVASDPNKHLSRVNGYDYTPIIPRSLSQFSLSRTEQRIRATGAHGLATKPVSDYLPVAMSKSTRAELGTGTLPGQLNKRKGKTKHGEKDSKYVDESDDYDEEILGEIEEGTFARRHLRKGHRKRRATSKNHPFKAQGEKCRIVTEDLHGTPGVQYTSADQHEPLGSVDDRYDEEEEEDQVIEVGGEYVSGSDDGVDKWDEGEDEDEAEYDEAENSVVNESSSGTGSITSTNLRGGQGATSRKANPFHMRLRSATPDLRPSPEQDFTPGGTQMSRATSGTGVSADDALVLSD